MNKIFLVSLILVGIFTSAVLVFKIPVNNVLIYGGILLCPLMHLFMMNHGGHGEKSSEDNAKHQ
jgi:hypothetical protein